MAKYTPIPIIAKSELVEENGTKYFVQTDYHGKTDKFRLVEKKEGLPRGYVIWSIGRHNFSLTGYIPMCRMLHEYNIDTESLLAVNVHSEELCEYLCDSVHEGKSEYDLWKIIYDNI